MKQKLPIPKEDIESQHFAQWLSLKGLKFTHIANESGLPPKVAMIAAAKKKRLGLSAGVPDFMIIIPAKTEPTPTPPALLFVEMKRVKGSTTSPEQKEWIEELNKVPNVQAVIAKGADYAIAIVESFL